MENDKQDCDMPNEVTQDQHTQVLLAIGDLKSDIKVNHHQNIEILRRLDVQNGSIAELFEKDEELQKRIVEHPANCIVAEDVRDIKKTIAKLNLERAEKKGEGMQRNKIIKALQHPISIALIVILLSQGSYILHLFFPHLFGPPK